MDVAEFAARLADADDAERAALLERYAALVDSDLARALKRLYDDTESSDPTRAAGAAIAPQQLEAGRWAVRFTPDRYTAGGVVHYPCRSADC